MILSKYASDFQTSVVQHWNESIFYDYSSFDIVYFREVAQEEFNAADEKKIVGIALLTIISIVTVLFYFFVRNALSVIEVLQVCFVLVVYIV